MTKYNPNRAPSLEEWSYQSVFLDVADGTHLKEQITRFSSKVDGFIVFNLSAMV